ncbi:MAG: CvpA family protein [Rhizobacter sp.]|nr:CvpA family protein [Chlorobiales bacterium]
MQLNWLDIALAVPLLFAAFGGWRRGFAAAAIKLFGVVAGFVLATTYNVKFGAIIASTLPVSKDAAPYLAFALIFVGALIVSGFVAQALTNTLKESALGGLNSLGGAALGVVTNLIVISGVLILLLRIGFPPEETRRTSLLYSTVKDFAPKTFDTVTSAVPETKKFYEQFRNTLPDSLSLNIDAHRPSPHFGLAVAKCSRP